MNDLPPLSRREREVMDIVHELGEATASQIRGQMESPPSDGAIRSVLRILVSKGHLEIEQRGPRYVYSPTTSTNQVRKSAMRHLLRTFFGGSAHGAIATLLELEDSDLSTAEKERIQAMIDRAAEKGR
ncbi:MAG: BlaI/MecI/CopY family transcriptional regulator [Acidobacteriota bacterium]